MHQYYMDSHLSVELKAVRQKQPPEVFYKNTALKNLQYSKKKPMSDSLFKKVAGPQARNFIKKRL